MSSFRPGPPDGVLTLTSEWADWLTSFGVIRSIRADEDGTCLRCRRPVGTRDDGQHWWHCWQCKSTYRGTAAAVVPISYSASGGLTSLIAQAKDEPDRWWVRMGLASLVSEFITQHQSCLENVAGGSFHKATVVPSHPSKRAGRDHLKELVGSVDGGPGVGLTWDVDLLSKTRADGADSHRNVADPELFSVHHPVVGQRILLLDDLYTSGGTTASAAAALIAHGATPPVILTIGRHLDDEEAITRQFVASQNIDARGWEPDTCPVHPKSAAGLFPDLPW